MNIEKLKNQLQAGYEAYADSRQLAEETWEYFHNRQYTQQQLSILENRGQPKETFNIIKLFTRMLLGYYSTVINSIRVKPKQYEDIPTANVLNDVIHYIINENKFDKRADNIKLDGMLSGLMVAYLNVVKTPVKDIFHRDTYDINISYVPSREVILDPMSVRPDYKDARFIHRFKWISKETFIKLFGKEKLNEVDANQDFLNIDYSDEMYRFEESSLYMFNGRFVVDESYLIVHSVVENEEGELIEYLWCGDTVLHKTNLTELGLPNPYVVVRVSDSDKAEYYGIFKEILETQKAINQALVRIQLLVNTNKVLVERDAVENLAEFKRAYERVNSIVPVLDLNGIKVENLNPDIVNQYNIINSAFDRIQKILGINDSFLGMAYASDSGRKVKLQQNQTIMALRYLTRRIELFYELLGENLVTLIKKYYTAYRVLRIADEVDGEKWIEINRPLTDQNGQPIMMVQYDEKGEPKRDEVGNILVEPLNDAETDFRFTDVDIEIETNVFNDEDERNQLILETFINGAVGQALVTVNPSAFFKIASLNVKNMKSKYSPEIAQLLEQTARMLQPQPQMQQMLGYAKQAGYKNSPQGDSSEVPMSQELKLPTNTNEGA